MNEPRLSNETCGFIIRANILSCCKYFSRLYSSQQILDLHVSLSFLIEWWSATLFFVTVACLTILKSAAPFHAIIWNIATIRCHHFSMNLLGIKSLQMEKADHFSRFNQLSKSMLLHTVLTSQGCSIVLLMTMLSYSAEARETCTHFDVCSVCLNLFYQ